MPTCITINEAYQHILKLYSKDSVSNKAMYVK